MGFYGAGALADKLTTALSKGMRQRVARWGAPLLHDPKLLLLDEPTPDGLDPPRQAARATARWRTGQAVIISSHILQELAGNL